MILKEYYKNRLEENLRRSLAAHALAAGVAGAGGAAFGVAAPYIRDATTAAHRAIGNPIGGVEVSQAKAAAANKVGLVGSTVPVGKRALYGAGLGLGLLGAVGATEALKGRIGRRK